MAREFPIANGKLMTDLDANGFKIINAEGLGGGSGGGGSDCNCEPPNLSGYATKEEVGAKRDRTDNIAAEDETQFTEWKFHCDVPEIQAALGGMHLTYHEPQYEDDSDWWAHVPEVDGYSSPPGGFPLGNYGEDITTLTFAAYSTIPDYEDVYVTATREKMTITKQGEPYVTPTWVKAIVSEIGGSEVDAIPKYEFVIGSLKQEEDSYFVILEPYHCTVLNGEDLSWLYFKVEAGGESGKVRDFMLVVDLTSMEDPPTITWPANFHPRTDAETDFACVAGVKNVYWISEYAEGEFCVAGWQETEGGSAV